MSDQDQYGNYMAQQPQPVNKYVNENANGNYNGSGNSQSFSDYSQSPGGYAGQQQVMYGEDGPPAYSEYGGQEYYAGSGDKLRPLPPRRRSKGWFWPLLILATLVLFMVGMVTGFRSASDHSFGMSSSMKQGHMMGPGFGKDTNTQTINLVSGMTPTLIINDTNGSVVVNSGGDSNVITVTVPSQDRGPSRNAPATFNKQNDTLSIDTSSFDSGADVVVTTPANVNVQVNDDSGDVQLQGINGQVSVQNNSGSISLDNFNGQANLESQDGSINLSQASLSGQSSIKTQSGSIDYQGSLSQQGNYTFESVDGSINLQLPFDASFQLVNPADNVHNGFNSSSVGSTPRPSLNVSSQNGDINIAQGQ